MSTILVTGANGQLGRSIQSLQDVYPQFQFIFAQRSDLDISDSANVQTFIEKSRPDWIINCAAYTAVDKAESETELCYKINEEGPHILAQQAKKIGSSIIHISSDYVYHSNFGTPFNEDDLTNPQSIYAKSKLAGEIAVANACPKHYIIRTSWVYSEYGHNFVKTMIRLGQERDTLNVVCDQIGAPTYARDLADIILKIIQNNNVPPGVYNVANGGQTSWYNFTRAIHQYNEIDCLVNPIRTEEYPTVAERPPYSMMNLSKIQQALHLEIRDWEDALQACVREPLYLAD